MNKQLSEFVGSFIGDGCMSTYPNSRTSSTTKIQFTGNWDNDSQYYQEIIKTTIEKNFKANVRVYHRKDDNTVRTFIYNKKVINFLKSLGYKSGPKDKTVVIQNKVIKDNRAYVLRVTSQEEVNKFIKIIKFNHQHHITRLNQIIKK